MATLVRRLVDFNKRLSAKLEKHLPQAKEDLYALYDRTVAEHVSHLPEASLVVDVGGGRSCSFAAYLDKLRGPVRLIAVDISEEELRHNSDVDETRVADAGAGLPFGDGEVSLVVSRTVLEHVADVEAFVAHTSRVLCDGGHAIHLVPCRNAPFAVIARLIPFNIAKAVLHFMRPESVGVVEFPVFYDRCTYDQMRAAHLRHGFSSFEASVSYYQSDYFEAVFPAYLISALYELIVRACRARNLGAYMLVIARK